MATDLIEWTVDIVIAHASMTEMTTNNLLKEINGVYATLESLRKGKIEIPDQEPKERGRKSQATFETSMKERAAVPPVPAMTMEEAFKPDQVGCMICGKTGMKTMKRHLFTAHNLKPAQYRKQFNIPRNQTLSASEYVAMRRRIALDRSLGDKLAAAREAKMARQMGE